MKLGAIRQACELEHLTLRSYQLEDLEDLINIDRLCFPKGIAYTKADFQHVLRQKESHTIVAQLDHRIVGFALTLTSLRKKHIHLVTLDVLPKFQEKGIGTLIFKRILKQARLDKLESIHLEVAENNERAIRFYLRQGFQTTKRQARYYANQYPALFMTKKLKPAL